MLLLLLSAALAGPPSETAPRVWVGVGANGGAGLDVASGGGGGFDVEAGVRLGREPRRALALAARVREGVASTPLREIGNIEVQVQYPNGRGPYALAGFTHNHEALGEDWLADPIGVTAGTAPTISHRSGIELGGGWDFGPPFEQTSFLARFRPVVGVTAHLFPDLGGPRVYVVGELCIRFGLDGLFGSSDADRPEVAPPDPDRPDAD